MSSAAERMLATLRDIDEFRADEDERREDDLRGVRALPQLRPEGLVGWVGDVARIASHGTEVNPMAAGMNALAYAAACINTRVVLMVGDDAHRPMLNLVHVGRTSRGGKGMATALVWRIHAAVNEIAPGASPPVAGGDLSTGEGLAFAMRDPEGEDPGIEDKRLWAPSGELAAMLSAMGRQGNTLSAAIRNAWDGKRLGGLTKRDRTCASDPGLCVATAITAEELRERLRDVDVCNGMMNRFLLFWAERVGIVPFPRTTADSEVRRLAARLGEAVHALPSATGTPAAVRLGEAAQRVFAPFYAARRGRSLSSIVAALAERHAPYALRIATVFCVLDRRSVISPEDMRAGIAWVDFALESTEYILANDRDELYLESRAMLADEIMALIPAGVAVAQSELTRELRHRAGAAEVRAALEDLIRDRRIAARTVPRADGKTGRPKTIYERCGGSFGNLGSLSLDAGSLGSDIAGRLGGLGRVDGGAHEQGSLSSEGAGIGNAALDAYFPKFPKFQEAVEEGAQEWI